jgi:hypothetical protein
VVHGVAMDYCANGLIAEGVAAFATAARIKKV